MRGKKCLLPAESFGLDRKVPFLSSMAMARPVTASIPTPECLGNKALGDGK